MGDFIALIQKYWMIISISFTIFSSVLTGGWYLKGKIDTLTATVAQTNDWVSDHDDSITQLHDTVTILKEDERLREVREDKSDKH